MCYDLVIYKHISMPISITGPTYKEMLNPALLPPDFKKRAMEAVRMNLMPITYSTLRGAIRREAFGMFVLPRELTGVKANILVMLGKYFPSGSHKVGPHTPRCLKH